MDVSTTLREPSSQGELSPAMSAAFPLGQGTSLLILTVFWLTIYVAGMFSPALLDDADSVHAEAAREMVLRHDWVTLHINGLRYLEKAPLLYWGMAGSFKIFGVSEWSARLPLMLGVLSLMFATYGLGRYSYGEAGGFYSALVLGTAVGTYLFTRILIPDLLVGLWLTLGFYFFLRSLEEDTPSRLTCWGFAATCALNVLTKGLIGLVFPAATIGLYLILTGKLRHLLKLRPLSSTLVFLALAAPWHILAALRNPTQGSVRGFLWFYFVNEHFLRYLNKRVPRDYDTVPLLVFWALLLLWMLPWTVYLPQALKKVPLRWRELRAPLERRHRANLLFVLWALVVVSFFSFSTRQEYYTIPALSGLALLIGGWLGEESASSPRSDTHRSGRISSSVLFGIGLIIFVLAMFLFVQSKAPAPGADLAGLLRMKNAQEYTLSFGHISDLTPQSLGAFRGPLLGVSLAFLLGTGTNWFLRRLGSPFRGNLALAAMMVVVLLCVHSALVTFSPILSSKNLALAIQKQYRAGDVVVIDDEYEQGSTLNFYLGVPVRILHERTANLYYGSLFPDAPHVFETPASFNALWSGPTRIFLWTDQDVPRDLEGAKFYVLARDGGKSILTNQEVGH
jgi:4-amino-4-deoxy-L-arabinose transferase-like glycosyltransferase